MSNSAQAGQDTVLHMLISCTPSAKRHAKFALRAVVRTTRDSETNAADGKVTATDHGSAPAAQQHATYVNVAMKEQTLEKIAVVTSGRQKGFVATDTRLGLG